MSKTPAIITDLDAVKCPLCDRKFTKHVVGGEIFYACAPCNISINKLDPDFGTWDTKHKTPCPCCGKDLRIFTRALDGFEAIACRECKVASYRGKAEFLPPED